MPETPRFIQARGAAKIIHDAGQVPAGICKAYYYFVADCIRHFGGNNALYGDLADDIRLYMDWERYQMTEDLEPRFDIWLCNKRLGLCVDDFIQTGIVKKDMMRLLGAYSALSLSLTMGEHAIDVAQKDTKECLNKVKNDLAVFRLETTMAGGLTRPLLSGLSVTSTRRVDEFLDVLDAILAKEYGAIGIYFARESNYSMELLDKMVKECPRVR